MITYGCNKENKKLKKEISIMKKMMNDNNVTKKLSFIERLAKYVEDNAEYFANLHCVCSGDFHSRF